MTRLLRHWDPWREMDQIRSELNRAFCDAVPAKVSREGILTPVNVSEDEKNLIVTAELPGIDEKKIDVTLSDNVLTIRGEKTFEKETEDENYYLSERSYGSFERSLSLPTEVDSEQVDATFEKGVLKIVLPKADPGETTKKIAVRRAE